MSLSDTSPAAAGMNVGSAVMSSQLASSDILTAACLNSSHRLALHTLT